MAIENKKRTDLQLPESNKVIVIGAGPVGLVASLLLSKYYVPHVLVEQEVQFPQHDFVRLLRRKVLASKF